ncbi:MAG: bifunctional DNA primase/polymerase [Candidatus Nanopelagicales bacterium]
MMRLRSVALTLASRWPILPVLPNGKRPATRSGVDSATGDLDRISAWWEKGPTCNVGIRTGSGLVAIDLDINDAVSGFSEIDAYAYSVGADPGWTETYTVATPSGGAHMYFQTSEDLGNRVGMLPGVDVRGTGGYVLAPYSRINGSRYLPEAQYEETVAIGPDGFEHLEDFEPQIAPAPEWLVDLIARPKPAADRRTFPEVEIRNASTYLEAVLLGERHRLMLAKPGERNHALNVAAYRLGKHVAAGRIEYDQAESWLIATAHHSLSEDEGDRGPLTEQEIHATVRSGLDAGVRNG